MTILRKICFTVLVLLSTTVSTWAKPTSDSPDRYQIEVIIFKQTPLNAKDAVKTSDIKDWPPTARAKTLLPAGDKQKDFQLVNNYHLNRQSNALAQQTNYQVLSHLTWEQDIPSGSRTKPVHIYGGNGFDNEGNVVITNSDPKQLNPANTDDALVWELDGTIRFSRNHDILTSANFILSEPNTTSAFGLFSQPQTTEPFKLYVLKQGQRMRPDTLHYFDNPSVAMLIKITQT
ncbi:MAG: hypothetical protein CMF50_03350 [Legionellales bacterium]|nr:hypothetical protein [Legionellales bacterium]|tara:strand:+ start:4023 stop:4718 length:696 start_codon:yes stop_codon:yes gene_type:complete